MRTLQTFLFVIPLFLLFQSCSDTYPAVCTDELRIYTVAVMDMQGEPADSVRVEVSSRETGEELDICGEEDICSVHGHGHNGIYVIMHDGFFGEISEVEERLLVVGTREELQFSEEFVFRSGECHVEKLAGPDTVSLESK